MDCIVGYGRTARRIDKFWPMSCDEQIQSGGYCLTKGLIFISFVLVHACYLVPVFWHAMETFISDLSRKEFPLSEKISATTIRSPIMEVIRAHHPDFDLAGDCALTELNIYRQKYIADYLAKEVGELSVLESTVLNALKNKDTLSDKLVDTDEPLSVGQQTA